MPIARDRKGFSLDIRWVVPATSWGKLLGRDVIRPVAWLECLSCSAIRVW